MAGGAWLVAARLCAGVGLRLGVGEELGDRLGDRLGDGLGEVSELAIGAGASGAAETVLDAAAGVVAAGVGVAAVSTRPSALRPRPNRLHEPHNATIAATMTRSHCHGDRVRNRRRTGCIADHFPGERG